MTTNSLSASPYVSLRTYRRSGLPVDTPVWLAPLDEHTHYLFSAGDAGKVKRLKHTAASQVATCDVRGGNVGTWQNCQAYLVTDEAEIQRAYDLLLAKYGWQMHLTNFFSRLTGRIDRRALIRLEC